MTKLTGKQTRYLRSLGHHLEPVVQIGKDGLTEGVLGALDVALEQHELIKVRLGEAVGGERRELAASVAEAALASLVQVLGRTMLLYRRRAEDPQIRLPEAT